VALDSGRHVSLCAEMTRSLAFDHLRYHHLSKRRRCNEALSELVLLGMRATCRINLQD
jgi:hypothetical protein